MQLLQVYMLFVSLSASIPLLVSFMCVLARAACLPEPAQAQGEVDKGTIVKRNTS